MASTTLVTEVYVKEPVPDEVPWTSPGCYHTLETCPGSKAAVAKLRVKEARRLGYTACGKCV